MRSQAWPSFVDFWETGTAGAVVQGQRVLAYQIQLSHHPIRICLLLNFFFCFVFRKVSSCSPSVPEIRDDPPALAFQVLGSQVCVATPGSEVLCVRRGMHAHVPMCLCVFLCHSHFTF